MLTWILAGLTILVALLTLACIIFTAVFVLVVLKESKKRNPNPASQINAVQRPLVDQNHLLERPENSRKALVG
ncbi:unnamed protein product, partial [Mesorhabditis belari]|uniref:Uncharacterized protein n=1 Tax=Mesorhabditis belari TaxID=2138241 RepID=A0AAF3E8R6_9BILA